MMDNIPQRMPGRPTSPPAVPPGRGRGAREHVGLALLAVQRAGRRTLAHMRRSRLLLWHYSSPAAEELLLTPPDLRAVDASFADEIAAGSLGLAGAVANLGGRSPFAVEPPSLAWSRELHGFGWLRHLGGAGSVEDRVVARKLVGDWIGRSRRHSEPAWEPAVVGRRIVSWLSHAGLLLDGAEPKRYAAVMRSLTEQITYLATAWRDAPDGYPRLIALIGLVHAALSIAGHDRRLAHAQALLAAELERQVPTDGGHISRNPWMLVELLLDLLPLRRCLAARSKTPAPALLASIHRMTAMLRHLRLGDGALARFNGMGVGERDALANVLAYDEGASALPPKPMRSGYVRLERGSTVIVADAGPAPPMGLAGAACAGCLSFELSSGAELVLVNGGYPGPAEANRRPTARATPSHNTLCLGERSSARLVRDQRLEREIGGPPLHHPDNVTCAAREADDAIELEASHDGYVEDFGLIHTRTLKLDSDGTRLEGRDRLVAEKGVVRFAWDVPYAIHFHLHPSGEARIGAAEVAELWLGSGELWQLTAVGAAVSIEGSLYFADVGGPQPAQQVVLRAQCYGAAEVSWTLERIAIGGPAYAAALKRRGSGLVERLADTSAESEALEELPEAS
jgi:uncharacterized heparinase superfamily protein